MASHQIVLMSLLILLVVFSQSVPTAVSQELKGKDLMKQVCEKTEFPPECIVALDSNPDMVKADMPALMRLAMLETSVKLRKVFMSVINDRLDKKEDKDPRILASLAFCRDTYKSALDQIQEGINMFDQKKYDQSYGLMESANKAVVNCNNQRLDILNDHNLASFRLTKDAMMIIKMH